MLYINVFVLFSFFLHQPFPLEVAHDGDDDIEGVEGCLEGDVFVEVEGGGDDIDGYPYEPLLQILVDECPDADDAQGCGEAVGKGDVGVGEGDEQPVDECPHGTDDGDPGKDESGGEVADGDPFCLAGIFPSMGRTIRGVLLPFPNHKAIDGHGEIVEFHAAVGIESFLVVEHDAQQLHEESHCPHPKTGTILEPNVEESEYRGQYVEPIGCEKFLHGLKVK